MTKREKIKSKYKKIMLMCISLSLILHIAAVFSLHKHLLAFSFVNKYFSSSQNHSQKNATTKLKEEQVLIFSFDKNKLLQESTLPQKQEILPGYEDIRASSYRLDKSRVETKSYVNNYSYEFEAKDVEETYKNDVIRAVDKPYEMKKCDNRNSLMAALKKEKVDAKQTAFEKQKEFEKYHYTTEKCNNTPARVKLNDFIHKDIDYNHEYAHETEHLYKEEISSFLSNLCGETGETNQFRVSKTAFMPYLPHIPSLDELNTVACGDDFEVDIEYLPRDDGLGYLFALTLIPKVDREFKKLKQNFHFLIDKSNSIKNSRYTSARQAVISSIGALNKKDTFNIYTFDNTLEPLFDSSKLPKHQYVIDAKKFLLSQKLGTFLSYKSLALPFNQMLKNKEKEDEINNIILITNGDDLENKRNCKIIDKWSALNNNKQSLFILALEGDKNLSVLDLFAAKNNGQLVVSHSIKGMRKNLIRLIKGVNYPVAKNVSVKIVENNKSEIVLYPSEEKKTHLYYDQPYVIMGTVKSLDDFVVFIQGKNPDKWFSIKKEVSFTEAKEGNVALAEKWAQYKANQYYDKYLQARNEELLIQAEDILAPFNLTPSFRR